MTRARAWKFSSWGVLAAAVFLAGVFYPPTTLAQSPDPSGILYRVTWQAQVFGRIQHGVACWLDGPQESLRLEILPLEDDSDGLAQLLDQHGEGFSLILGLGSSGTFNRWGREWRNIGGALPAWVRLATGILAGANPADLAAAKGCRLMSGTDGATLMRPRFLALESSTSIHSTVRVQMPGLGRLSAPTEVDGDAAVPTQDDSFRKTQVGRGQGRGGRQEILTFRKMAHSGGPAWEIKSSRKPGRIILSRLETWRTSEPGPEVFAPLWPLGQLLDLERKLSGTFTWPQK